MSSPPQGVTIRSYIYRGYSSCAAGAAILNLLRPLVKPMNRMIGPAVLILITSFIEDVVQDDRARSIFVYCDFREAVAQDDSAWASI